MKLKHSGGLALATLLAAGSIARAATVIDFSSLADGTAVTNEYPGVVFSLEGLPDSSGPPTINTYADGTGLANSTNPDYPTANILNLAFTVPVSALSFTFSNYGTSAPTTYTAYNAGMTVVDSGNLQNVSPASSFQLVSVVGSGITDLQLDNNYGDTSWYFAIQEVTFTPSTVPEPGSLGLVVAGLVGLIGFARRRLS